MATVKKTVKKAFKAIPRAKPALAQRKPKPTARQKLDAFGIDALCAAIMNGVTLTATALSVGVAKDTLLTWIQADGDRSARVREARIQVATVWDEQALEGIQAACDFFELAKARESAQHLRWRSSKIAPKVYGEKLALGQADDMLPLVIIKDLTGRKD